MSSSESNLSKFFNKKKIQKSSDEEIINLMLELWSTLASEETTGSLSGDELLPFVINQFIDIDLWNIFLFKERLDALFENNQELYFSLEGNEQYIYTTLLSAFYSLTEDYKPPVTQNKHAFFTPAKTVGLGAFATSAGVLGAGVVGGAVAITATSSAPAVLTSTAAFITGAAASATIGTAGIALLIGLAVLAAIGIGLIIKGAIDQHKEDKLQKALAI